MRRRRDINWDERQHVCRGGRCADVKGDDAGAVGGEGQRVVGAVGGKGQRINHGAVGGKWQFVNGGGIDRDKRQHVCREDATPTSREMTSEPSEERGSASAGPWEARASALTVCRNS